MYLIYIIRCTLCTWCSRCCMILWGLQGADGALDVVVDQVYGELEGVVDKLAKEAQRGTLPRLVHRWLSFFIFYFFICCQQTKNIARYPAKVCWWPISIKMAKIPQSSIFHKDFFWQNILLQENLPETPSNNQPQQQQQPQQQRHNNQRQQLVSLDRFKLSFWPSVMVFKVEVRQEPSFLPDLNHAICTAQQQRNATEVIHHDWSADPPVTVKIRNLRTSKFSILLHCFQSIRANENNGAASNFPQSVS